MDTRKEVLFVLIEEYADWEFALLAPGLRRGFGIWEPQYDVRTVAADAGPVMSIGGVRCLPDYTFETIPDDYAALVLVGGMNWWGEEAPAGGAAGRASAGPADRGWRDMRRFGIPRRARLSQ